VQRTRSKRSESGEEAVAGDGWKGFHVLEGDKRDPLPLQKAASKRCGGKPLALSIHALADVHESQEALIISAAGRGNPPAVEANTYRHKDQDVERDENPS
jgi:hypothetical protein